MMRQVLSAAYTKLIVHLLENVFHEPNNTKNSLSCKDAIFICTTMANSNAVIFLRRIKISI
jgi:hypothetical protein